MTGMPPTTRRSYWEAILAAEGMPAEPAPIASEYRLSPLPVDHTRVFLRGRLAELVTRTHQRKEDALAYDAVVRPYLHEAQWWRYPRSHRRIWALHVDLVTERAISERVDRPRRTVRRIIAAHLERAKRRAGL